jgi:predicted thioesterase
MAEHAALMNYENVSQICFEDSYTVPAEQTARALFARLPHGCGYAERMIECLATGYLVAVVESICIGRLQEHVHPADEVVVGQRIHVEHLRPMPQGARITLRGFVSSLGERRVTFRVRAQDAQELVCEAIVTLVALPRQVMQARIDAKRALIHAAGCLVAPA